ncbi:MAG TPA: DUF58 domain-containing protein [Gaiellaceae bacterium]|nr:DUF58 domain-containing protein [Gaiellaceae bacterium]
MRRLGGALVLGCGVTSAALAFGSRPLGVAGVGLLLAAGGAAIWAGLVRGPVTVDYQVEPAPATEGERVRLRIEAHRASRLPVGSLVAHGVLGRLGPYENRLRGHGRTAAGELDLGKVPRGAFWISDARVVLGDYLGLESVSIPVDSSAAGVVVHPRVVDLQSLFSDSGRHGGDGRRLILRRPAGFDFHSVREYERGESLRRVHWPTTARRGQLMVKELEDDLRDAVVVLLDCDSGGAVGAPPDSSFDTAVRATGSILKLHAARGRRATLVTTGTERDVVQMRSLDSDFRAVLDALARAVPDASHGLARSLGRGQSPAGPAGELVVVTAILEPQTVEALLGAATRQRVSVVWIDAPSFVGRPTRAAPGPLLLAASGIPTAVVRSGDDLAAALDQPRARTVAGG